MCLVCLPTARTSPPSGEAVPPAPAGQGATSNPNPEESIDGTTHGPLIIMAQRAVQNCSLTSDWPHLSTALGTLLSTFTSVLISVRASMPGLSPMVGMSPADCQSIGSRVHVASSV